MSTSSSEDVPSSASSPAGSATRILRRLIAPAALLIGAVAATGCTGVAPGIEPVSDFDAERYLGRWYEIARLDHSFERGLTAVTADYSRRDDGESPRKMRLKRARAISCLKPSVERPARQLVLTPPRQPTGEPGSAYAETCASRSPSSCASAAWHSIA